jgi:hypothetical protein
MTDFLPVGNDILDIGSRKARRQRADLMAPASLMMGAPGQFDLPNVANVRMGKPCNLCVCLAMLQKMFCCS